MAVATVRVAYDVNVKTNELHKSVCDLDATRSASNFELFFRLD